MYFRKRLIFVLMSVFLRVYCEPLPAIKEQLQLYKNYIKASVELEKQDRSLINTWTEEMQVKQVNITSTYRLQMARHREHCFRRKPNQKKWQNCMAIYEKEIKKPVKLYYDNESECLKVANSADMDKKLAVSQIEKEIRKWRKSYRYLLNLCHSNHPDNEEEAGVCLVEFMQRDNYNMAIQRLLILKLEAMGELSHAMNLTTGNLENCLKTLFSVYLENIRFVMEILGRCYGGITRNVQKDEIKSNP